MLRVVVLALKSRECKFVGVWVRHLARQELPGTRKMICLNTDKPDVYFVTLARYCRVDRVWATY